MSRVFTRPRINFGLVTLGPLILFLLLRFIPGLDPLWADHLFHFYIVSFTSLVALVVAILVLAGVGSGGAQALFTAMAFVIMAALFLLHGILTPGLAIISLSSGAGTSARLSLTAGAVFLSLALADEGAAWDQRIANLRHAFWVWLGFLYAIYIGVLVVFPNVVNALEQIDILSIVLAAVTIALLLWGAWRAHQFEKRHPSRLSHALTIALPWLALAQLSQFMAPMWTLSWWLYHVLMLGAFAISMGALVRDYEQVLDFRLTRYFVALGVIVGVPVAVLLSEAAVRLSGLEAVRWPMLWVSGLSILLLFVVLYIVIRRAEFILEERRRALEEQRQWRIDFTNLIVHDLKTPLSVTSASLKLVLGKRLGELSDKQRMPLERAERATRETLELIDNLLDIEKIEAGQLRLATAPCDLTALIRQTAEALKGLAEAYKLTLNTTLTDTLPEVCLDEALIRRVLQNLMTNAIKFTPENGTIQISAVQKPGLIEVSVSDSGVGVPLDQRQRIFEKYVQVTGLERRGVGLGLAFCRLAVEAHHGSIRVEDGPDGKGSRFVVQLPLDQNDERKL